MRGTVALGLSATDEAEAMTLRLIAYMACLVIFLSGYVAGYLVGRRESAPAFDAVDPQDGSTPV